MSDGSALHEDQHGRVLVLHLVNAVVEHDQVVLTAIAYAERVPANVPLSRTASREQFRLAAADGARFREQGGPLAARGARERRDGQGRKGVRGEVRARRAESLTCAPPCAPKELVRDEQELADLLGSGRAGPRPHIGAVFPLKRTSEALRLLADGDALGKVLIDVSGAGRDREGGPYAAAKPGSPRSRSRSSRNTSEQRRTRRRPRGAPRHGPGPARIPSHGYGGGPGPDVIVAIGPNRPYVSPTNTAGPRWRNASRASPQPATRSSTGRS